MKEKKIRMVVDKRILLADENLDLTKEITTLLNKKLKSIKIKLKSLMKSYKFFKKKIVG